MEGLLLGIAGISQGGDPQRRALPSSFQGREMTFIAAAVVGGVNIMGGSGKLLGAVFGAIAGLPAQHSDDLPWLPGLFPVRAPGSHHPDRSLSSP